MTLPLLFFFHLILDVFHVHPCNLCLIAVEDFGDFFQSEILCFWIEEIHEQEIAKVQDLTDESVEAIYEADHKARVTYGVEHGQCPCMTGCCEVIPRYGIGIAKERVALALKYELGDPTP